MAKTRTLRNPKYLAWLRTRPCSVSSCGNVPSEYTQIQAAHVRFADTAGMGQKPSDYRAVPLCPACHRKQHDVGEVTFWGSREMAESAIIRNLMHYIGETADIVKMLEAGIEERRKAS